MTHKRHLTWGTDPLLSSPSPAAPIMRRDASLLPPLAAARPAMVPAAHLAADLLAHPAPEEMVPRCRRSGQPDALGRDVERSRRGPAIVGRSLRASSGHFPCTSVGQAETCADRRPTSVFPAKARAAKGAAIALRLPRSRPKRKRRAGPDRPHSRHLTHTSPSGHSYPSPSAPSGVANICPAFWIPRIICAT